MSNIQGMIRIVIKKPNKELETFLVRDYYLDRLVTNLKLYQKDLGFVSAYRKEYEEDGRIDFLPTKDGIVFIDFENNIILNGQMSTGIGCVAPNEVVMSQKGCVADETVENSATHRFSELFDDDRLIGFEEWLDTGTYLNTKFNDIDYKILSDKFREIGYGQFRFKTTPFKIKSHTETDWFERLTLFIIAKELKLIPEKFLVMWYEYLKRIKR